MIDLLISHFPINYLVGSYPPVFSKIYTVREVIWNASRNMWEIILSCDGICILFWNNPKSSKIVSKLFLNYAPSIKPFFWVLRIDSYEKLVKMNREVD